MSLYSNITELQKDITAINPGSDIDRFMSYIDDAADKYIKPVIGDDLYEHLENIAASADFTAEASAIFADMPDALAIFYNIRKAEGYYALFDAYPFLNVKVGNGGMAENSNSDQQPVRQWMFNLSRQEAINKADFLIDRALKTMEAAPASYPSWSGGSYFSQYNEFFITNADDFSKIRNIKGSRRTFIALAPFMRTTQDRYIKDCIGNTMLEAMLARQLAGTFTAADNAILPLIKKALAHYSMFLGSNELNLDISSHGTRVVSEADGITSKITASATLYGEWKREVKAMADAYLAELKKYLDDNSDDYSEYTADDAAENETPAYDTIVQNPNSTGSVML